MPFAWRLGTNGVSVNPTAAGQNGGEELNHMQWYFVENGQQAGPVEEIEIPQLLSAGRLRADTLVWHEGMGNWEPFRTVCPPEYAANLGASTAAPGGIAGNEAVCAECGGVFNKDEMIPHGNVRICAQCKPIFMQKLAEGVKFNFGELNYASIGTRFGALVVDGILIWIVGFVIQFAGALITAGAYRASSELAVGLQLIIFAIQLVIGLSYETIMIGKYGATLGKMACKIKVVMPDGGRVSYLRALGRYFAKMLSGFTCCIGYIIAFFDKEERRTLHDHICNTRVVLK